METATKILQFVKPDSNLPFRQDNERQINRQKLINRLNYVNFQDGTILINFRHKKYFQNISLEAKPQPCEDDTLHCNWVDSTDIERKIRSCTFENFFVVDGHKLVVVDPTVLKVDATGITLRLPETGRELSYRKMRRHPCRDIAVQLSQNSAVFKGTLVDFNAVHFRIDLQAKPPQTFQWIDHEEPVVVTFADGDETYYSAICHIVKQSHGARERSFVLEPDGQHKPRFRTKNYRSTRQRLLPSPNVMFTHPLTDRIVDLKVIDISGTGFSVEESVEDSVLLPGLVIPEAEINFGNSFSTRCRVQVVHRKVDEDEEDVVRCGLAILDMDVQDHVNLLSLLYQVHERNSYLNNRVDMEKLWQFFFETGFIYPKKYAFIKANKEKYRDLYEKLYTRSPRIARHFIYQDKGSILGHMAMIRFYENSWLIHHHAASKVESNRAGLVVLNQIGRFINDSHRLHSIHLHYVFCYYRPDNKFPHRVFGGVARHLKNPRASSLDPMAYLHVQKEEQAPPLEHQECQLGTATAEDLRELARFYENHSGGLMIDALDLHPNEADDSDIAQEFAAIDFKRERHLLSLKKKNGQLLAVVTVVLSDVGLNMSDLTNCIKVFVLDQEELTKEVLQPMLSQLVHKFEQDEMPVLLYPASYADSQEIPYEKTYNLWVLSMNHTDEYFSYLDRLIKTVKH